MDDQQRAESYLCNSPHAHRLMRPFPFYLLFGKFTFSALRKAHQGLSCKKASLQSRQDGLGRFPGRILQQLQTQSVPDDGYLKKQPRELAVPSPGLAMATLIRIEMNSVERGKCTLLLLMCCKFKYFYQVEKPRQQWQYQTTAGLPGGDRLVECHSFNYVQILQMLTRKSELQRKAPVPLNCLNSTDFHRY